MKKILSIALPALLVVAVVFGTLLNPEAETAYKKRDTKFPVSQSWNGAASYYHMLRKNPATGTLTDAEVINARKEALTFNANKSGTTFDWIEMGPDNYGGRTRAMLFDNTDPTGLRIYAGGVSGGVFVSNNNGGTWEPVEMVTEAMIISAMAQGPDGTIWIGTGSTFDTGNSGEGGSAFLGSGLYKLEPGSSTIVAVASAQPIMPVNSGANWTRINDIDFFGSKIYVATNRGIMLSEDDGDTWTTDSSPLVGQDLEILSDGTILAVLGGRLFKNQGGQNGVGNYTAIGTAEGITSISQRMRISVSPVNENRVYATTVSGGSFEGFFESSDAGSTWQRKQMLSSFQPYGDNSQGFYDCMLQADPQDEDICYLGGIDIYRYNQGIMTKISDGFAPQFDGYNVHSDQHSSALSHANSSQILFGTDGGIYKTFDGGTQFIPANRGYNVTQFYSVAYDEQGYAGGGTQDNGTIGMTGLGFYPLEGTDIGGGDGFDLEYSQLTNLTFSTVYGEFIRRGTDNTQGGGFCGPWPNCGTGFTFYTNIALWESHQTAGSQDSITFKAEDGTEDFVIGISNGSQATYTGTINKPQASGNFVPGSIKFIAGTDTVQDLGTSGILTGSGDAEGTFDYNTGVYSVTFDNAPSNQILIRTNYQMFYNAGSTIQLSSETPNVKLRDQDFVIDYTLTAGLQPGDSVLVQDPVQSIFVYGRPNGDLYLTRDAIRVNNTEWFSILGEVSGDVNAMDFSKDGNHLFVGTTSGRVYRVSGLSSMYTQADAADTSNGGVLTVTLIASVGSSQTITGLSVDKNDADNLVFTVGGYGTHVHVYRTTEATTTMDENSFSSIQADLPSMPVYDVVISNDASKHIVIGTEYGVYSALFNTANSWTNLNNGLPLVPVFAVRQQTNEWEITDHTGEIYLGTHGRGIWRTTSLATGANELPDFQDFGNGFASELNLYPNPSLQGNTISVKFKATESAKATVTIYDLTGKMISQNNHGVNIGDNILNMGSGLTSGNYIVSVSLNNQAPKVSKLVVY